MAKKRPNQHPTAQETVQVERNRCSRNDPHTAKKAKETTLVQRKGCKRKYPHIEKRCLTNDLLTKHNMPIETTLTGGEKDDQRNITSSKKNMPNPHTAIEMPKKHTEKKMPKNRYWFLIEFSRTSHTQNKICTRNDPHTEKDAQETTYMRRKIRPRNESHREKKMPNKRPTQREKDAKEKKNTTHIT